mmetsp:Transcript_127797/g.255232  ORF Transcript_127797/g.255232 Transcript_127797/m.255232 type:complete len:236 (-) Transcript_127797:126-833(-)
MVRRRAEPAPRRRPAAGSEYGRAANAAVAAVLSARSGGAIEHEVLHATEAADANGVAPSGSPAASPASSARSSVAGNASLLAAAPEATALVVRADDASNQPEDGRRVQQSSPRERSRSPGPDRRSPGMPGRPAGGGPTRIESEIRRLQASNTYFAFTRLGFARLVREIQQRFTSEPFRWSSEALMIFQMAAEEYLMYLYADAYLATHHRQRVTLTPDDLRLVRRLREPHCWGEPQ